MQLPPSPRAEELLLLPPAVPVAPSDSSLATSVLPVWVPSRNGAVGAAASQPCLGRMVLLSSVSLSSPLQCCSRSEHLVVFCPMEPNRFLLFLEQLLAAPWRCFHVARSIAALCLAQLSPVSVFSEHFSPGRFWNTILSSPRWLLAAGIRLEKMRADMGVTPVLLYGSLLMAHI